MAAALEQTGALLVGHFQLNSGRHADRYLEKFNLLQWPQHTELVCGLMADAMRHLEAETVAGPTTGGVLLAYEVGRQLGRRGIFAERNERGGRSFQRDFQLAPDERVLVVDDVLTSGASVSDTLEAVREAGGTPVGVAVMVDRSAAAAPAPRGREDSSRPEAALRFGVPFFAATRLDLPTYQADGCPLCRDGVPLTIT